MHEDADLVSAFQSGDAGAAHGLYNRHVRRVWGLALRMVQRRDLAEDCVQEAFIRAFERIGELREPTAFGAWLINIAYRIAVDLVRKEARDREFTATLGMQEPSMDEPDVLLRARLVECMAQLDNIYSEVFVLYELLGLRHSEIADCLGIPEGSSKRRLFEARSRLRVMLEPVENKR